MALLKGFKAACVAGTFMLAAITASPAMAQGGKAGADEMKKAESAAIAAENAKKLGQDAPMKVPAAVVPVEPDNVWDLDLSTGGRVRIQLRPDLAPNHVERIKTLTRQGLYNGLKFHRVIPGFMAQGGDPKGDGTGGSSLPDLKAEFNMMPHLRGTVSMARAASEDSANSQFFIVLLPRMQLDKKYTVFGRVIEGMQYVDSIAEGEPPANPSTIVQASIESDGKAPPAILTPPVPAPPSAAELSAPIKKPAKKK